MQAVNKKAEGKESLLLRCMWSKYPCMADSSSPKVFPPLKQEPAGQARMDDMEEPRRGQFQLKMCIILQIHPRLSVQQMSLISYGGGILIGINGSAIAVKKSKNESSHGATQGLLPRVGSNHQPLDESVK